MNSHTYLFRTHLFKFVRIFNSKYDWETNYGAWIYSLPQDIRDRILKKEIHVSKLFYMEIKEFTHN